MLSHDLRTALGGVTGNLGQLQTDALTPDNKALVEAAQESAAMIQRFLEDLESSFEADEEDIPPLQIDSFSIGALFGKISAQWAPLATAHGSDLNFASSEPEATQVATDLHRMKRIVGNALQNALKYGSGGALEVELNKSAEGTATIAIRDEGPGFSPEALEMLFTYSGRPANSEHSGRGLGLYIAKTLVEELGGEITARNRPSGGAEVQISLPEMFTSVQAKDKLKSSVSIMPNAALPDLSGFNILLAEDNVTNQVVVAQMLDAMGAEYTVASDGIEGLDQIETGNYDLALVDIEMPRLSGLDLIRQVRGRSDQKATLPLVAFTAYAMREHRYKISEAGADGLIAKPVTGIEDLGNSILRYLPVKRMRPSEVAAGPEHGSNDEIFIVDESAYARLEASIGSDNMVELLKRVEEDLSDVRSKLVKSIEHDQVDFAQRASHVLISVAGAIGATPLQQTAQRLNTQCHSENASALELTTRECLNGIDSLLNFVQKKSV